MWFIVYSNFVTMLNFTLKKLAHFLRDLLVPYQSTMFWTSFSIQLECWSLRPSLNGLQIIQDSGVELSSLLFGIILAKFQNKIYFKQFNWIKWYCGTLATDSYTKGGPFNHENIILYDLFSRIWEPLILNWSYLKNSWDGLELCFVLKKLFKCWCCLIGLWYARCSSLSTCHSWGPPS